MKRVLPLEKMSIADKLAAMEQLWDDLSRDPEAVPSPPWHESILAARDMRVKEGKAKFTPFAKAKDKIRKSIK